MTVRPLVAWNVLTRRATPLDEARETYHRYDPPTAMPSWSLGRLFVLVLAGAAMWGAFIWWVLSW